MGQAELDPLEFYAYITPKVGDTYRLCMSLIVADMPWVWKPPVGMKYRCDVECSMPYSCFCNATTISCSWKP